jgi:hypothetical protein
MITSSKTNFLRDISYLLTFEKAARSTANRTNFLGEYQARKLYYRGEETRGISRALRAEIGMSGAGGEVLVVKLQIEVMRLQIREKKN